MTKITLKGVVALVFGGIIASCTHDFDYSPVVEQKKEAYQQVFVSEFGRIAPNHTWGFTFNNDGTLAGTRAMSDYMSYKGSTTPQEFYFENGEWKIRPYTFPSDCDASNFTPNLSCLLGISSRSHIRRVFY